MKRAIISRLLSVMFLTVFFSKMAISIAPLIAAHFDARSVKAAIMQLEIENDSKPADVKEVSVKEYFNVNSCHVYMERPVKIILVSKGNNDHAKHIQPFYPPVPTPPPDSV